MKFQQEIVKHLNKLADVCAAKNPDTKHNTGRQLGVVYFWTMIEKYAKGKKEEAWSYLATEKIIAEVKGLDPGEYSLAESPSFFAQAKVSEKVKRFDAEVLAEALYKKYKVPKPVTKELVEQAKVPSSSTVTKSVVER